MPPIQEFRNKVADASNLFTLEPDIMEKIISQYFALWTKDRDPMYVDMCVEAIYEAF